VSESCFWYLVTWVAIGQVASVIEYGLVERQEGHLVCESLAAAMVKGFHERPFVEANTL